MVENYLFIFSLDSIADPKTYVSHLEQRLERLEQEKLELIKVHHMMAFLTYS